MRTRTLLIVGLLISALIAGVASFYASPSPDGLERVSADHGLGGGTESSTAKSPVAGYEVRGLDSDRAAVGLAGLAGVGITALVAGGVFALVRRRNDPAA